MFALDPHLERMAEAEDRAAPWDGAKIIALGIGMAVGWPVVILWAFGYTEAIGWWIGIAFVAAVFNNVARHFEGKGQPEAPSTTYGAARFLSDAYEDDRKLLRKYAHDDLYRRDERWPLLGFYRSYYTLGEPTGTLKPVRYCGPAHLLTIAPSRSGKGTDVIIPNLLTSLGRSFVVIDPKGENAAITTARRKELGDVFHLNPFNEHGLGTHRFNPLAGLTMDHPRVVSRALGLAEALVPGEAKPSGNSEYFTSGARQLVQVILLHLIETQGEAATLPALRPILTDTTDALPRTIFMAAKKSQYDFLRELAGRFEKDTKSNDEITATAQGKTAFLSEPRFKELLSGSDFRFVDLKSKPTTVFVILPSTDLERYSQFLRLVVATALEDLQTADGGKVPTTFLLDEFPALGFLSPIMTAIGQAAGFNIQLWPFVQDLSQLRHIYADRWESFIANAGAVQWFAPQDKFTQEYLSKRLGQQTVKTWSRGKSKTSTTKASIGALKALLGGKGLSDSDSDSEQFGETGQPLMAPNDLAGLDKNHQIITFAGSAYPLRAARFGYFLGPTALEQLSLTDFEGYLIRKTLGSDFSADNPYR